jgi:hypothetical protein
MFKGLSNFAKSKNAMWVLVIIVVLFGIWALMSYSKSKSTVSDSMTSGSSPYSGPASVSGSSSAASSTAAPAAVNAAQAPAVASGADLLPKDPNSQWSQSLNPNGSPSPIVVDVMAAGAFIGLDSIGQTLRNANLQLRSDPIIDKREVGPWMNSTIEPDFGRVPLELGN